MATGTPSVFDLSPDDAIRYWDDQWDTDSQILDECDLKVRLEETAMRGYLKSYCFHTSSHYVDPESFLRTCTPDLTQVLQHELNEHKSLKIWLNLAIEFEKATDDTKMVKAYFCSTKQKGILASTNLAQAVTDVFPQILNAIECFQRNGSNWVVLRVHHLHMHVAKYSPLNGSCHIQLPRALTSKKAVVNVKNKDNQCFMWSVLAALFPTKEHAYRVSKYQRFAGVLNFNGITSPVSLQDIPQFEQQNELSINVYGYSKTLYPLHISKSKGKHIDLLYYKNHYCYIRNLDRLLFKQNRHKCKKYYCHFCLFPCYSEDTLTAHIALCENENPTRIEMPESGENVLRFSSVQKMLRQVSVIYADFECLTEKIQSCSPSASWSFTEQYQLHTPCSYGFVNVVGCCNDITVGSPEIFRGPNACYSFLQRILQVSRDYQGRITQYVRFYPTTDNESSFDRETCCHICHNPFFDEDKVRDHCHCCGQYRGAAHNSCNQQYRLNGDLVVIFHNLRRYDSHLLMQQVGQFCNSLKLTVHCVAKNMEDYITFFIRCCHNGRKYKIRFIDSCQFLQSSLENLVSLLKPNDFRAMQSNYKAANHLNLLLRKGVYPYDYMDSFDRFNEKSLPTQSDFYSKLLEEHISDEDYAHAQNVWDTFHLKNLGEYHDLYLSTDVLLLADVFENFRKLCLTNYFLDPCHYCTLPSFAWDACLKFTQVELELLVNPDMYSFFELGIRGGISTICHRYARANNPLIPDTFDPAKPTSYILYLDANNLYGWSMCNFLPHSNFHWLTDKEIQALDFLSVSDESNTGYVLEVDLTYPDHLHATHNNYPLAPEKMIITEDLLSPYCKNLLDYLDKKAMAGEKLVPNFFPKFRYIVHYRNLQLYVKLGLQLDHVHRVMAFHQEPWMMDYIKFNTHMRQRADSDFAKDLFKLLNNAVFGKTMENKRKRTDIKLPTKPTQFQKLVANPRYERSTIFTDDLVGVAMASKKICLDKPIYAGFSVLELSKLLMYNFHYKYVVPKYANAKLLFTDTDSLCYYVETKDVYKDMLSDLQLFDTSDYPTSSYLFSTENKKVLGKMKDETAGVPVEEFIGLRSKMYSILCGGKAKKRAKGVKKSVVKKSISHQEYKAILYGRIEKKNQMNLIRSKSHIIHSVTLNKTSLSCYDDKRYLLPDGISSLAYGHMDIKKKN